MKTYIIVLVSLLAIALAQKPLCGCKPAPPICASNHLTYMGICPMGCDTRYHNLYKLYDGPCLYDTLYNKAAYPSRKNLVHQLRSTMAEQYQGNNFVDQALEKYLIEQPYRNEMLANSYLTEDQSQQEVNYHPQFQQYWN